MNKLFELLATNKKVARGFYWAGIALNSIGAICIAWGCLGEGVQIGHKNTNDAWVNAIEELKASEEAKKKDEEEAE